MKKKNYEKGDEERSRGAVVKNSLSEKMTFK